MRLRADAKHVESARATPLAPPLAGALSSAARLRGAVTPRLRLRVAQPSPPQAGEESALRARAIAACLRAHAARAAPPARGGPSSREGRR